MGRTPQVVQACYEVCRGSSLATGTKAGQLFWIGATIPWCCDDHCFRLWDEECSEKHKYKKEKEEYDKRYKYLMFVKAVMKSKQLEESIKGKK